MVQRGKLAVGFVLLWVGGSALVTASDPPRVDDGYRYVSEPVDVDAAIPGCDSVERPTTGESFGFATFGGDSSYDSSQYPWYSGPKATAMTSALVEALPNDVTLDYAPRSSSLEFQPIDDYSDRNVEGLPDGITVDDLGGEARADGSVTRAGVTATLSVAVEEATRDVPPCTAGVLDERRRTDDGAVLDLNDTWSEYPDLDQKMTRTYTRSVDAWLTDGTFVRASMSSPVEQWPMSRDELVEVVLTPGLETTAAVPPGTPSPAPVCPSTYDDEGPYVSVTPELVDAWNSALRSAWPDGVPGLEIDRNLASLEPADTFLSGACATFDLVGPVTAGVVGISISSDHAMPVAPDPYDPQYSGRLPVQTALADGSVEVVTDDWYSSVPMNPTPDDPGGMERYLSVEVTHPSGFAVSVFGRGTNPPPVQILQAIASTPGLDVE